MGYPDDTFPIDPVDTLEPLGQWGWMTRWPDEESAARWVDSVRNRVWPCSAEIVPAYHSVAVIATSILGRIEHEALRDSIVDTLVRYRTGAASESTHPDRPPIEVPVIYDGPDLNEVAETLGMKPTDVVDLHTSTIYRVFAVGFLPGFPYAGYLPDALGGLPRRLSPRSRVPGGSVAIVGRQTGIYPRDSPGGWHILGHTKARICDLEQGFFLFRPTDQIRFIPSHD
jgi:KipI family sensor histidine kinase inhibitor